MREKILYVLIASLILASCKKQGIITSSDALLNMSADTLYFDTVFTTTGSTTQLLKIFNDNNQRLVLAEVRLAGGNNSPFKLNVDGIAGSVVQDVNINANDSIYAFVSVKINPAAGNLPFVIRDSIGITYNGNVRWVQLEAWGQNANFRRNHVVSANETWGNDLPYVLLGGLQVAPGATLTLTEGCRIFVHADAPLLIDGTLQAYGKAFDSARVVFQGDRLDEPYRDFPGAWPGIIFRESSRDNVLNFVTIKNAYQGIVVDKPSQNANPKLILNHCVIDNCYDAGILSLRSSVNLNNCLVSNCGKNVMLVYGGTYNMIHCTIAAYSNAFILHREPVLLVTNFIRDGTNILTADLSARFSNCIFWGAQGTVEDEVVIARQGTNFFEARFSSSLWKIKNTPSPVITSNMIVNQDPQFDSVDTQRRFYNFRLKDQSPAIDKGEPSPISIDLDGRPRQVNLPDLGSYEKQ